MIVDRRLTKRGHKSRGRNWEKKEADNNREKVDEEEERRMEGNGKWDGGTIF